MTEANYVTVLPTVLAGKYLVVVMQWSPAQDGYVQGRCSQRLSEVAAHALAESWSKALGVEIR